MGCLSDFDSFLAERQERLGDAEKRLTTLQSKFETFFNEMRAVRESELQQLLALIHAHRDRLPASLSQALDVAQREVEKELDAQVEKLDAERRELERQAEEVRAGSLKNEEIRHEGNVSLDADEESLKARSAEAQERIDEYNDRIRELARGFGLVRNYFAMRALESERGRWDAKQAKLVASLNQTRNRWVNRERSFATQEAASQTKWSKLRTKASTLQAKIEHLRETREDLVTRTVLEKVLYARRPTLPVPVASDPKCPRCGSANPPASHFCQICAKRLKPDRPDLEGSLEEIAEANHQYARFAAGMKSCQEIIGLVRGIRTGFAAFRKSVQSMQENESRYRLKKLELDVPAEARPFSRTLDALHDLAQPELSHHPQAFAERLQTVIAKLGEAEIKNFFETLGGELSRRAKSQWG